MTTSRRTWVWILVAVAAAGAMCLVAVAGAGFYFFSKRVHAERLAPEMALRSFDEVMVGFQGLRPLYEADASSEPRLTTPYSAIPTAVDGATDLWVQAWDPDRERLVKLSLPLWLLRYGDRKMRVFHDDSGIALQELSLDADELARIGPAVVLDYRQPSGVRVLLWTK